MAEPLQNVSVKSVMILGGFNLFGKTFAISDHHTIRVSYTNFQRSSAFGVISKVLWISEREWHLPETLNVTPDFANQTRIMLYNAHVYSLSWLSKFSAINSTTIKNHSSYRLDASGYLRVEVKCFLLNGTWFRVQVLSVTTLFAVAPVRSLFLYLRLVLVSPNVVA